MATVFTHALVGAGIAYAAPASLRTRRLLVASAVLAMVPDLDVIAFAFGIPYAHPLGHRGLTHAPAFALLVGALLAWRWAPPRAPVALVLALAMASHGALDALTDAGRGVGFLLPFDGARFFAPWRPLATSPIGIDAFFSGPALRILANELMWIGLPLAACVGALRLLRRD